MDVHAVREGRCKKVELNVSFRTGEAEEKEENEVPAALAKRYNKMLMKKIKQISDCSEECSEKKNRHWETKNLAAQVRSFKYKLKYHFENLDKVDENITWSELGKCVDHHLFLLTIFDRMRRIYSVTLLFHYFVSVFTACFDMYESFIGEDALADQVIKSISMGIILGQFAFYAIPADLIASEVVIYKLSAERKSVYGP
ncbi:7tm Odorant receptor [Popillia japonica]|uniref:7tm Odorant receptor n=1 Tax=Popillia japonica TaxID=7064 RepID=A0AAW1JXT2_POPJA